MAWGDKEGKVGTQWGSQEGDAGDNWDSCEVSASTSWESCEPDIGTSWTGCEPEADTPWGSESFVLATTPIYPIYFKDDLVQAFKTVSWSRIDWGSADAGAGPFLWEGGSLVTTYWPADLPGVEIADAEAGPFLWESGALVTTYWPADLPGVETADAQAGPFIWEGGFLSKGSIYYTLTPENLQQTYRVLSFGRV